MTPEICWRRLAGTSVTSPTAAQRSHGKNTELRNPNKVATSIYNNTLITIYSHINVFILARVATAVMLLRINNASVVEKLGAWHGLDVACF